MPDLRAIDVEPVTDSVVTFLEHQLERAKAGEFSAVSVAIVYRDGTTGSGWSMLHNLSSMVGSVEALKLKLVRDMVDGD